MTTTYGMIRTTIYLDADTLARVKALAARQHVTASHLIRVAMQQAFARLRPLPRGGILG